MTLAIIHRHALETHVAGLAGGIDANHLAIVRRPSIFSVVAPASEVPAVSAALHGLAEVSVRFCGPSEWFVVSRTLDAETLGRDVAAIGDRVFAIDQSDGRVLLELSGPDVRRILAKCLAVDLHPAVFAEGRAVNTLCAHTGVNLARTGADRFEILVMRSFAIAVFDELMEMGREFAMSSGFAP